MPKVKSSTLRVRKHRAITTIPLYPHEVNENAGADDEDDEGNLEINREDPGVVNEFQNLDVEFDSGESSGSSAGCEEGSGLFHSEDRSGSSHFEERSGSSHSEEGSVSSHFEEGGESSQSHRFKAAMDIQMSTDAGIRKALNVIVKKYLGRDLVLMFTAVKKIPDKELFRDFNFCSCLQAVACPKFNVTEEEVLSHIGTIFGNAKDWDGKRKGRRQ